MTLRMSMAENGFLRFAEKRKEEKEVESSMPLWSHSSPLSRKKQTSATKKIV